MDLEDQQIDKFPLLMDSTIALPTESHTVTLTEPIPTQDEAYRNSQNHGGSTSSDLQSHIVEFFVRNSSPQPADNPYSTSVASSRRDISMERNQEANDPGGNRQRVSPLNSGLWISIELTITLSQLIASVIVLFISRDEKPQAPLGVWVVGYAAGCLATLPYLYWRYANCFVQQSDYDSVSSSVSSSPVNPPHASYSLAISPTGDIEEVESDSTSVRQTEGSACLRIDLFMERFKIILDSFFAVWFVLGNVWIFGAHSSSAEAPNLYRLCIAFLTFSCISYAMPFILCATICCCLPCIISLLGGRENQGQTKGASSEVIEALPTFKFKLKDANRGKGNRNDDDSDSEATGQDGIVASGTERERTVLPEDAVCCICLEKYEDDDELRELPCAHFFHVECVDKWLKINASCPLCKRDIIERTTSEESAAEAGEQSIILEVV